MSTQNNINLSELDFEQFLNCGQIIQIPGSDVVFLGQGQAKTLGEVKFVQSNFTGDQIKEFSPEKIVQTTIGEFTQLSIESFNEKTALHVNGNTDDQFLEDLESMKGWILSSKPIEKLVAVTTASYKYKKKQHPLSRIKELVELNGSIYGMWNNGRGFLGASPEPLFQQTLDGWATKALAGTISTKVPNYESVLLSDEKERLEHKLVIDDISSKLKKIASKIVVKETECVRFGKIAHIQTIINFQTDQKDPTELIKSLSPTAALGGYPSEHVNEFLVQTQYYKIKKQERIFGAIFGIKKENVCVGLVSIRNIYWEDDDVFIHSGCGVVKDSIPEKELIEVQNKRATIERIFL